MGYPGNQDGTIGAGDGKSYHESDLSSDQNGSISSSESTTDTSSETHISEVDQFHENDEGVIDVGNDSSDMEANQVGATPEKPVDGNYCGQSADLTVMGPLVSKAMLEWHR